MDDTSDTHTSESITKELGNVINTMLSSFDEELFATPADGLDRYWHFRWDNEKSLKWNTYQFHDMLDLYASHCRRWEEHHHSYICLVERVRDKYIMPKITDFLATLSQSIKTEITSQIQPSIADLLYWRDLSECDCSSPLPQGGCLRCDLEKFLSHFNHDTLPQNR